jgi:pimeloyl-ACP methyl ester carboxylesterase
MTPRRKRPGSGASGASRLRATAGARRTARSRARGAAQPSRQPRSATQLGDDLVERALVSGEHAALLERYFGEDRYRELCEMAREAQTRAVRGGPRVLILPGIMGSKIGRPRAWLPDDVIWIDPLDIARGALRKLALGSSPSPYAALGVLQLFYLKLKLRLRLAGFDADHYPFDWRKSIAELGAELAAALRRESAREVFLVAHSMGGLVARAAIAQGAPKVARLVMLGTPNFGSFVPVQALRAVYDLVRKVAFLDAAHSPEELASRVFSTFPSLYEMLPARGHFQGLDLYDPGVWPRTGPQPRPALLARAPQVQQSLAPADARFFLIAGVNRETVTDISKRPDGELEYHRTLEGDETVPLACALLPGARTYFIEEAHGSLPNNGRVGRAVAELIDSGHTTQLDERWRPRRRGVIAAASDAELRAVAPFGGRRRGDLGQEELRHVLDGLLSPDARDEGVAAPVAAPGAAPAVTGEPALAPEGYAHEFDRVVVGRRAQRRLEIRLALGNLAMADTDACVVGLFSNVDPAGAALDLDARLDGAIVDFAKRRVFGGEAGQVFILPTGRHELRAELIAFAGLGPADFYGDDVQRLSAENVMRTFVRTRVDDVATVLFGSQAGHGPARSLRNLLVGFLRALRDADADQRFRRLTFCIRDDDTYREAKTELYRLASTDLFADVEVTIDERRLPEPVDPIARTRRYPPGKEPVYLIVRHESSAKGRLVFRSAVLPATGKATVMTGDRVVGRQALDAHLRKIESRSFTFDALAGFGERLASLVIDEAVLAALGAFRGHHLVVVHDAGAARIPWETLRVGDWSPAADGGVSRRYTATNLSPAKWLEQRAQSPTLQMLLVVNPTRDLPGAEREGRRVRGLFGSNPGVRIDVLEGQEATRARLLAACSSGKYDVLHYAGHAYFDRVHRARSGILCHRREVLSGADLAGVGNLPALAFFNACEVARVRAGRPRPNESRTVDERLERNVSFAEAFLRGGVANYVGTYWPVGDDAAAGFADAFYCALLGGRPVGDAIAEGRRRVHGLQSVDWADYVHYGSYDFVLKAR